MKRCPECRRDYYDETLLYCLDDGTALLEGPAASESATAVIGQASAESVTNASETRLYDRATPADHAPEPTRRNRNPLSRRALFAGPVIAIILAAVTYGIFKYVRTRTSPISFTSAKITQLTATGKSTYVAISPDGKYVVHVQDDGGQQSLWVRQVNTQSNVQIMAPASIFFDSLAFSPDGDHIYYCSHSQETPRGALFQVPTLGGSPKRLLVDLEGTYPVSFSPDGKQLAFVRSVPGKGFYLMIVNADGTGERKLLDHKNPPESIGYPAWSPDGKSIAYRVRNADSNDDTVFEAQVADGSTKPLTSQRWFRITGLAWLSDSSGLLMIATPGQQQLGQIWQLSYPEGEPRRLTNDLTNYSRMSLTADSNTLATVKIERQSNVWIAPLSDPGRARAITSGTGITGLEVTFAPDGKIVYSSVGSGDQDIWTANPDGSDQRQLTANARINGNPSVSTDGRYIVFMSDRSGTPHIWRMNIDGSDPRQLTDGATGEQSPTYSPDGRWVVYRRVFGKSTLWKIPAEGGEPVQLNDKYSTHPTVSPDNKLIAYRYTGENAPWRIGVASFEGGEPLKTFDPPASFTAPLRWARDGHAIAYIDTQNGVSNIIMQALEAGAAKPLTNFTSDRIFWFDLSRDGKWIALSRGMQTSDILLIKDFR